MQHVRDGEVLAGEIIANASAANQSKKRGNKPGCKRPRFARAFTGIADDDVLLTKEEVGIYFGGPARPLDLATIYRGAAQGRYPLPVQIGPNTVRWLLSECREARRKLMDARGKVPAATQQGDAGPAGSA
jgi:hypothetical protein